jgi:hypothetical protein
VVYQRTPGLYQRPNVLMYAAHPRHGRPELVLGRLTRGRAMTSGESGLSAADITVCTGLQHARRVPLRRGSYQPPEGLTLHRMVGRPVSRRWSPERLSLGRIYDIDWQGSCVATSKQAKAARIPPRRHGDTEKELMRFARCLNGHQREAPKIPTSLSVSPCLRVSVAESLLPWLARDEANIPNIRSAERLEAGFACAQAGSGGGPRRGAVPVGQSCGRLVQRFQRTTPITTCPKPACRFYSVNRMIGAFSWNRCASIPFARGNPSL